MNFRHSSISTSLATLRDSALTLLYPQHCALCPETVASWCDGVACAKCWEATNRNFDICDKCGAFMPGPHLSKRDDQARQVRCGKCDDLEFVLARSCGRNEGALRANVLRLKTHPHLPARLRELLFETFSGFPQRHEIESIIPFPLHQSRLKERTFNQAEVIAKALALNFHLPLDTTSLKRIKATDRHRAGMDSKARGASLEKAFKVQAPRLIEDRTVLIVDDTMTTGSTANEITRTLLVSGARQVFVLTLARAFTLFD